MTVKIRLQMVGRKNRPCFRLVACDEHVKRDGKVLEVLGQYDPLIRDQAKQLAVQPERVAHWLKLGAMPTPAARTLLGKRGVKVPARKTAAARKSKRRRQSPAAAPAAQKKAAGG